MVMARLFVCVWPDDAVAETLAALVRKDRPGVRFVPEENWHVTLRFLGRADTGAVAEALADVRVAPTQVAVGPVVELLSDHSIVVHADGLGDWAAAVNRATRGLGEAPIRKRFVGHITLARLSGAMRRGRAELPSVVGTPIATSFTATELALVASHLEPRGARYETLATFAADR